MLVAVVVGGCYTGSNAGGPPPPQRNGPPPTEAHRGPIRCPPGAELDKSPYLERCVDRAKGQPLGPMIERDEHGKVIHETTWRDGRMDGVERQAYPGGAPAFVGHWREGHRAGTWTYYFQSGARSHELVWENDQVISHRVFDERGGARPFPAPPATSCTTDADCTIGYTVDAGGCCSRDNDCGAPMPKRALEALADRCTGMYCGPPKPSSSCMGVIGKHAGCRQGACVWQ